MAEPLIFGSPEANRVAAEIRFLESVEDCPACGGFGEVEQHVCTPDRNAELGMPLVPGIYYRLGCPKCGMYGGWKKNKRDAMLGWSSYIEEWLEVNGERFGLDGWQQEDETYSLQVVTP